MSIFSKLLIVMAISATMTGVAAAQNIGGGTPDAENGARGRDQPTSYQGHRSSHRRMRVRHYRHHAG